MINSEFVILCNNSALINNSKCGQMEIHKTNIPYVVEAFIEPWIFSLGLITNILSICVLKHMKIVAPLKLVLMSLCVSDGLASIFGFTYVILEVIVFKGDLTFGIWLPGSVEVFSAYKIYLFCIGISSVLIKLGSIIKMYALLHPLRSRIQINCAFIAKIIASIIFITVILFVPLSMYIMWKTCFQDKKTEVCINFKNVIPNAENVKYYFFALAMVMGPGMVIGNVICFTLLKQAIKKSHMSVSRSLDNYVTFNYKMMQAKQGTRINKTFLYGLLVHTICIVPSCAQILCLIIDPINLVFANTMTVAVIDAVAEILLGILPCYNFWLYLIVNKDFRKKFKSTFLCKNDHMYKSNSTNILFTSASIDEGLNNVVQNVISPVIAACPEKDKSVRRKTVRFSQNLTVQFNITDEELSQNKE